MGCPVGRAAPRLVVEDRVKMLRKAHGEVHQRRGELLERRDVRRPSCWVRSNGGSIA